MDSTEVKLRLMELAVTLPGARIGTDIDEQATSVCKIVDKWYTHITEQDLSQLTGKPSNGNPGQRRKRANAA